MMRRMKRLLVLLAGFVMAGCAATAPRDRTAAPVAGPAEIHGSQNGGLPFISDDYPKALAEARARKLPIFIEAWAPW